MNILERIEAKFIFCDVDAVERILLVKSAQEAKIFTVNGKIGDFDGVESLLVATGSENEFSYEFETFNVCC